jgi:hypothetical protein
LKKRLDTYWQGEENDPRASSCLPLDEVCSSLPTAPE